MSRPSNELRVVQYVTTEKIYKPIFEQTQVGDVRAAVSRKLDIDMWFVEEMNLELHDMIERRMFRI